MVKKNLKIGKIDLLFLRILTSQSSRGGGFSDKNQGIKIHFENEKRKNEKKEFTNRHERRNPFS